MQYGAAGVGLATGSESQRGYGRPTEEGGVVKQILTQPEGYYVSENRDERAFRSGSTRVLCRPDGTEVWSFDPAAVFECEVILEAFDDHSDRVSMEA